MRYTLRIVGGALLVAAMMLFGYDAIGWLTDGRFDPLSAGRLWYELHPTSLQTAEPAVARYIHPFLWHPIISSILVAPAFVVFGVPGAVALWFGRKRR